MRAYTTSLYGLIYALNLRKCLISENVHQIPDRCQYLTRNNAPGILSYINEFMHEIDIFCVSYYQKLS